MSQDNIQTIASANERVTKLTTQHLGTMPTIDTYEANLTKATHAARLSREQLKERLSIDGAQQTIDKLTSLINVLEEKQDLRLGIIRTKKEDAIAFVGADKESQKSSVIIRDARLQEELSKTPGINIASRPNDVTEGWMINASATTRGVIKLLTLPPTTAEASLQINSTLKLFEKCMQDLEDADTPEKRTQITEHFNHDIKNALRGSKAIVAGQRISDLTDKEFNKVLGNARDFTNFETKDHHATITITGNLLAGTNINHIESFIPVVPLSEKLKERYSITKPQTWRDEDLSPINRALVNAYSDKITGGQHIIPTQLQFLPGIRNYGVTSTLFASDNIISDEKYTATRCAAPAYNIGKQSKKDKSLMQTITDENVSHINNIAAASGQKLHINTLTNEMGEEKLIGGALRTSASNNASNNIGITQAPLSVTLSNKDNNLSTIWDNIRSAKKLELYCCKSGKDRTGLVDKHNQLSAIKEVVSKILGNNISNEERAKAFSTFNCAWHNENLAGSNGGSLGSYGLKANTSYVLLAATNVLQSIKNFTLGNKAADLNTPKTKLSENKIREYAQHAGSYDDREQLLPNDHIPKKSSLSRITSLFKRGPTNRDR